MRYCWSEMPHTIFKYLYISGSLRNILYFETV